MPTEQIDPPLTDLTSLRPPLTAGEQLTLTFLYKNLGQRWEIYIQPHLNGLRPDFVLLNPDVGIVVIEVKDWNFDAVHYWYQERAHGSPILMANSGGRTFSKAKDDPLEKLELYKNCIYNIFCPRLPHRTGYGNLTSVLVLTNATTSYGLSLFGPARNYLSHPQHQKTNIIAGFDVLRGTTIETLIPNAHLHRSDNMSQRIASDLRSWLIEPNVAKEQRKPLLETLDHRQQAIVLNPPATRFRRVRGPSGSGKSLVLAARAAKLAGEGKRVLVVSFNITLINYLLDLAVRYHGSGKVRKQIIAWNFHYWCKVLAVVTGNKPDYDDLWEAAPHEEVLAENLALNAIIWAQSLDPIERYDAIFVDEGQDFRLSWWLALRSALNENGEMLLCMDGAQNVYGTDLGWLADSARGSGLSSQWYELSGSYRLPQKVAELGIAFLQDFLPEEVSSLPVSARRNRQLGVGEDLCWVQVQAQDLVTTTIAHLKEYMSYGDTPISWADVTILVETEEVGVQVVDILQSEAVHVIDTFPRIEGSARARQQEGRRKKMAFFKGDARPKVTTIQSFKGWESSAVIILISRANSLATLSQVYVAMTRVLMVERGCMLHVICSEPLLAQFGQRWPGWKDRR